MIITRDARLFDSTAVDNIFISELMPSAPDNAVKVYLYGLMQTVMPTERAASVCDALGLSEEEVAAAFRYWQKQGAVDIVEGGEMNVRYLNLREALPSAQRPVPVGGRYAEFVKILQLVLGTRSLSGAEMQRIYDWIEVFGFEEDAAVEIVRHCIELKGARVHINYMDSVAKRLAASGTLTYDAVHEDFASENRFSSMASAILRRWHVGRRPTDDETALCEKWVNDWGFSQEAVDIACGHVVASDKPNFKYLDAILENYHKSGSVSADDMRALIREQDMIAETARLAFEKAGLRRSAGASDRQQFAVWQKDWHMSPELIICAAELSSGSTRPFAEMKKLLTEWHSSGIASPEAARQAYERRPPAAQPNHRSVSRALNYSQNRYTDAQLRELGIDTGEDIYED